MSSPNLDPDWHPDSGIDGRRTGHGGDNLHRFLTPGSTTDPHANGPPPVPTAESGAHQPRKRRARAGWDVPGPRPGWYAYRITGPAELPSWATEVALAIERPPDHDADHPARRTASAVRPAEREWTGDQVQSMVLFRAPGRTRWLAGAAEAIAEIERAAGVRAAGRVDEVTGVPGIGARLTLGPGLPGLVAVAPAVALAGVGAAGARGLPAPLRRWRPAAGAMAWRASAGAVVTCEGPYGVSAQAVVALRGLETSSRSLPRPEARWCCGRGAPGEPGGWRAGW